jgi:hypothetical protein
VALLTAWLVAPAAVPIYDGIGNPDEPYRYVSPPADAKTSKTPTVARATVSVRNGQSGAQFANSGETAPQISVYLPAGALRVPAGATSITVTATPKAPGPPAPAGGAVIGNVYALQITAGSAPVTIVGTGNQEPTVQMRSPGAPAGGQPNPVFEQRTGAGWKRLKTTRVGNDVYQTQVPATGDYALVQLTGTAGAAASGSSGVRLIYLVPGIALLAVTLLVVAIRLRRTRSPGR